MDPSKNPSVPPDHAPRRGREVEESGEGPRAPPEEGRRARRPPRTPAEKFDFVNSRENHAQKEGTGGTAIHLRANHFAVRKRNPALRLSHYHVQFDPKIEQTGLKKALLRAHKENLPPFVFNGASLIASCPIIDNLLNLTSTTRNDATVVQITLKLVGELNPTDPMYLQFYNIMTRSCLQLLDLTLMGRNYFDHQASIPIPNYRLQIWPGFLTTLRQHENQVLYCVQSLHKIIRTEDVFQLLQTRRREIGDMNRTKEVVRQELLGTIVITHYNKKTYRVDDICWGEKASDTFDLKGVQTTYVDYYKDKYNIIIQHPSQPLLVSNPKKRDVRRGETDRIKLIPELCNMTGLTDSMRQNFNLMRELGQHLFQKPDAKVATLMKFIQRIRDSGPVQEELKKWNLEINNRMVELNGRVLNPEKISFKDAKDDKDKTFDVDPSTGDFTRALRSNCRLYCPKDLRCWVCIIPHQGAQHFDNLISTMQTVSRPLGFQLSRPVQVYQVNPNEYLGRITAAIQKYQKDLELIFTVLPNNKVELYSAIKKLCYVDYGISSQCFMAKNVQNKGLMSIATKLVVQMNCKLGGEAWLASIPLKNMMVIGVDVYQGTSGSEVGGRNVVAIVATTSASYGKYFSSISFSKRNENGYMVTNLRTEVEKCINTWKRNNGNELPERIMIYRDGVGEGQLQFVYENELRSVKELVVETYRAAKVKLAKFSFIVVSKKVNLRLFKAGAKGGGPENPLPGTIADNAVTLPERYDFYLIAQAVRQGTVSPTSYNILFDRSDLSADKIQILTYKLCHMYYNFSGTVSVPAPCQYAHKLAQLTGLATKIANHPDLAERLYFL